MNDRRCPICRGLFRLEDYRWSIDDDFIVPVNPLPQDIPFLGQTGPDGVPLDGAVVYSDDDDEEMEFYHGPASDPILGHHEETRIHSIMPFKHASDLARQFLSAPQSTSQRLRVARMTLVVKMPMLAMEKVPRTPRPPRPRVSKQKRKQKQKQRERGKPSDASILRAACSMSMKRGRFNCAEHDLGISIMIGMKAWSNPVSLI